MYAHDHTGFAVWKGIFDKLFPGIPGSGIEVFCKFAVVLEKCPEALWDGKNDMRSRIVR